MNGALKSISIKPSAKPHGYWTQHSTHKDFFDNVGRSIGIKHPDDWYKITTNDIFKFGGRTLLEEYYNSSIIKALQTVYPEHDWKVFKFSRVPTKYWNAENSVHEYLDWLSSQLNITKLDDWTQVSSQQLESLGAGTLLNKFGGLHNLLKSVFPEHPWKFNKGNLSKAQKLLFKHVQSILPGNNIIVNYKHPELLYPGTNREMELDLFIPELKIAFEYNGEHHYHWSTMFGSPETQIERDAQKRKACLARGITLIEIPYWWDRSKSQILAEIHKNRPDVVEQVPPGIKSIPPSLPSYRPRKKSNRADGSFEGFEVSFPVVWKEYINPTGWLVSFKQPGARLVWDGKSKFFTGRSKQEVIPPEFLLKQMPAVPLDGVLVSKDSSVNVEKILQHSTEDNSTWSQLHFYVLDAPTKIQLKYKDRLEYIQSILSEGSNDNTFLSVMPHMECKSQSNLRELIVAAEDEGLVFYSSSHSQGLEGVVIRNPQSYLVDNSAFFHAKTREEDIVAVVTTDPSEGTVTCKRLNNQLLSFRTMLDLKPGSLIQVAFPSSGTTIQPVIIRTRDDLEWSDLVRLHQDINYQVTQGKGYPQCRGCQRVFQDKSEWRIEAKGSFISVRDNLPHPVKYSLCIDPICITRATQTKKTTNRNTFPPFDGRIGVPAKVALQMKEQFSYWDVQWIEI